MRVFYKEAPFGSKVNFVDDNNILIGYDNEDDCCAQGGWFISDKKDEWLDETFKEEALDMPGWNFDMKYCEFLEHPDGYRESENDAAQFRLVKDDDEKFLTLYNFHNGYYSRGFEVIVNGKEERSGSV